ncbi:hypothetical protein LZ554_002166 [Drepanopeziza brunnea f. sp. 'monogermtubi']|nr:hypothetical protein LZ554_002166 [Drepanopeziza brunnea f. sp. 'monogermtubi']
MVKADLTRDYYGDLELPPTAEVHEIKKQFKKLALTYHPDRNPGRESEVTAKFQKIQSAHEVLIDPQERAKYDANKIRPSRYGGQSSGVRGNPWANAASAYPPPPKAPTAKERQRAPPPSTGARRYENFATPQQSAYAASQEGPQARKDTYTAWEHMRHQHGASDPKPGPGKTWKAPEPPPRGTPQSGREESNAKRHGPPPKAGPSYQEFREFRDREANTPRRSQSTSAGNKKNGFMPNTPGGGDEPPAPMGAYFTDRNKPSVAPEVPPREPRPQRQTRPVPDPLAQFKDKAMAGEPRISTPYSTHGGEKFDPFESTNINRSKSTRERPQRFDGDFMPRAGSDSNMSSVEKARAYAQRHSPKAPKPAEPPNHDGSSSESSSDGFVKMNAPASGTTHRAPSSQGLFDASTQPNTNNGPVPRSSRPQTQPQTQNNGDPIFSFNINDDMFSQARQQSNGFSNSADNISTKFTPEDWDGKFEAGADYFKPKPEQQKTRTQSTSRPRGRSPVKARPFDPKFPQPGESDNPIDSPSGAKFSADEWKETFKPQTFMPPPPRMASTPSRKRTGPALRPTMGGNAAVVSDGDSSDDKPPFAGRKNMASRVGSPEPMDVDTPPANNTVPQYTTTTGNGHLNVNNESSKRSASTSASQSRSGTEDLNVEFDDLHIRDLMSSMAMPAAPQPPDLPEVSSQFELPSRTAYDEYVNRFAKYVTEWDLFNSKFLLHMVARKNQTDNLKERRWTDEAGTEIYRIGVKEDQAVLKRWTEFQQSHETVIKAFIVVRERMKNRDEHEGPNSAAQKTEQRVRPRKKTH